MENFNEILTTLLSDFETHPECDITEFIFSKAKEMGLKQEDLDMIAETLDTLDAFDNKASDLSTARADGETRETWTQEQLLNIANRGSLNDEQKQTFVDTMTASIKNSFDEYNFEEEQI